MQFNLLSSAIVVSHLAACCLECRADAELFEQQVKPLLIRSCYECHGPDTGNGEGGLRLDSLAGMLRGGQLGPAIVPGEPDRSLLIHSVTHDPTVESMPPDTRLQSTEIGLLRSWIQQGAHWPGTERPALSTVRSSVDDFELTDEDRTFWAFAAPRRPPVPRVRNKAWPRNAIDAFLLAAQEATGVRPGAPAGKRALIRRATLDLHGLPPTADEVGDFLEDAVPDAFDRVIDRLLASPRYGERWGRHWLDVARYSDSNGMDDNIAYADAWRYRDYVIAAFNDDKPYDRFVAEQLAGDLLTGWSDPGRAESVIATTFLMLGPKMPSADDPIKQQLDVVDEQLDTVGRAFMGLTMGCARCHDHKFDPLSTRDYYALAGIFRSTRSMLGYRVDSKFNLTALAGRQQNELLARYESQLDLHDDALVNGNKINMSAAQRAEHTQTKEDALRQMAAMQTAMAVEEGRIEDMAILLRGNHLTPTDIVPRDVPQIFRDGPSQIGPAESGRRELARWLTSPAHPLTARVMVNRIWQWHFGQGIVRSVDNFGRLGERPDNQPLLDWLASRFIASGWSVKEMHRLLMTSSSYRLGVDVNDRAAAVDPENRLLWRMNQRRLEAEVIRDSLLAVGGLLDLSMGGGLLPIPNHKIMSGGEIQQCNDVHTQPRRTVYLPVIRSGLHEFLKTFDFPDPAVLTGRRSTTTVAPQALFMMNSELVTRVARRLSERIAPGHVSQRRVRIALAYEIILSRPPTSSDVQEWIGFFDGYRLVDTGAEVKSSEATESDDTSAAWQSLCRVLLSSNEFVYRN